MWTSGSMPEASSRVPARTKRTVARVGAVHRHAAGRAAEDPLLLASAPRDRDGLGLAGEELDAIRLDQDVDSERAPRLALAVQAVAAVDEQGLGRQPVADGPARAAAFP
jgi:hypothetical protein